MHFISLVAVEMPKITENQAKNQEVEKCLEELREAYKQDSKNIILELQIERLSGLTTEFARALDHSVCQIMQPYDEGIEDLKYLEFNDPDGRTGRSCILTAKRTVSDCRMVRF